MLYDAAALLKFYLMDLLTDNFWMFFKSKLEIAQKNYAYIIFYPKNQCGPLPAYWYN